MFYIWEPHSGPNVPRRPCPLLRGGCSSYTFFYQFQTPFNIEINFLSFEKSGIDIGSPTHVPRCPCSLLRGGCTSFANSAASDLQFVHLNLIILTMMMMKIMITLWLSAAIDDDDNHDNFMVISSSST